VTSFYIPCKYRKKRFQLQLHQNRTIDQTHKPRQQERNVYASPYLRCYNPSKLSGEPPATGEAKSTQEPVSGADTSEKDEAALKRSSNDKDMARKRKRNCLEKESTWENKQHQALNVLSKDGNRCFFQEW
jgi:hypothetical protein